LPLNIKHFVPVTPNAGDSLISLKSRDLLREIIPDANIMTFPAPLTEFKINAFFKPDIIVIGGGPLFASYHLDQFPGRIDIPTYILGLGTMARAFEGDQIRIRLNRFFDSLHNLRLVSTRENATKDRFERLGVQAVNIGCPVMHIGREPRWRQRPPTAQNRDILLINYRDLYIPKELKITPQNAGEIARKLNYNNAMIIAHSYNTAIDRTKGITEEQADSLNHFLELRKKFNEYLSEKEETHPVVKNILAYAPNFFVDTLGLSYYDPLSFLPLYHNASFNISYQLHSCIAAAATGTPFLHLYIEESSRTRDMQDLICVEIDYTILHHRKSHFFRLP